MALSFGSAQAYYDDGDFLLGCTSLTFAAWARLDTFYAATRQALWGHTGSVDNFRFQKDTNEQWHAVVTCGGVQKQVWDTTGAVVGGTKYHVAFTWKTGDAAGLRIFRNGAFVSSISTVSQVGTYAAESGINLYLDGISNNNRLGYCSLECFALWVNYAATDQQILDLYRAGWPHLAIPKKLSLLWYCSGGSPTYIPDSSGSGRHIQSGWIEATPTDGGLLGRYEDEDQGWGGDLRPFAAGPPPPNPWTTWPADVPHPAASVLITGLTNGTVYEFAMTAVDTSGNESILSNIVESTPVAPPATVHTPRGKLFVRT